MPGNAFIHEEIWAPLLQRARRFAISLTALRAMLQESLSRDLDRLIRQNPLAFPEDGPRRGAPTRPGTLRHFCFIRGKADSLFERVRGSLDTTQLEGRDFDQESGGLARGISSLDLDEGVAPLTIGGWRGDLALAVIESRLGYVDLSSNGAISQA